MSSSLPPFALADPSPAPRAGAGTASCENVAEGAGDKCDIFACLSDLTDLRSPTPRSSKKTEAQAIFQDSPPWLPGLPSAWSAMSPSTLSASAESPQLRGGNDDLRVMLASPAPAPLSQSAISASGPLLSTSSSLSDSLLLSPFVSRLFPDR